MGTFDQAFCRYSWRRAASIATVAALCALGGGVLPVARAATTTPALSYRGCDEISALLPATFDEVNSRLPAGSGLSPQPLGEFLGFPPPIDGAPAYAFAVIGISCHVDGQTEPAFVEELEAPVHVPDSLRRNGAFHFAVFDAVTNSAVVASAYHHALCAPMRTDPSMTFTDQSGAITRIASITGAGIGQMTTIVAGSANPSPAGLGRLLVLDGAKIDVIDLGEPATQMLMGTASATFTATQPPGGRAMQVGLGAQFVHTPDDAITLTPVTGCPGTTPVCAVRLDRGEGDSVRRENGSHHRCRTRVDDDGRDGRH